MRRMLTIVALAAALSPVAALAGNQNQETAQRIAASMTQSGKLNGAYRISVRYQDGTVTLSGQVRTVEQAQAAVDLAYKSVGVNRVVNELAVGLVTPAATPVQRQPVSLPAAPVERQPVSLPAAPAEPQPVSSPASQVSRTRVPASSGFNPLRLLDDDPAEQSAVQRVPATFTPAAARRVANNEPTEPAPMRPLAIAQATAAPQPLEPSAAAPATGVPGGPLPMYAANAAGGPAPTRFDQPCMPNHAWPSYAAYPNYAAVTYPRQYSPTAWPYIGPFYPYPQVPLGWRKVTLQWDDGWWMLDFRDEPSCVWWR